MLSEINLKGKVALVTGAKQGIGKCCAQLLAEYGADVVVMDLSLSTDDEVYKNVTATGAKSLALSGDVSKEDSVAAIFAEIKKSFGRFDILINNAGITKDGMSKKMSADQFRQVLEVNLLGSFICAKEGMAAMRETGSGGSIVNFSSVVGWRGNVGQVNYSASKAGLLGLTKTLALEGARDKIRVNAVAPGFIATPMTDAMPEENKKASIAKIPLARIGEPLDIANSVLFLVSELSSYITGHCIAINGGSYM